MLAVARLPAAEWTRRRDLAQLVAALGPGNARYVGGAVRDTLAGCAVKDVDVATPLSPDEVVARLEKARIRTVPTGLAHGTVTALRPGGPVEITTLRRDVSTDGRRATVAFTDDWREDASRRDFKINALYADPATLEISDWFGGLHDLAARRVRFIGDARARIREDHLRILRYFRFHARFGSQPADIEAESACAELAPMLKGLSRERVGWELLGLLALPDPAPTVARMAQLGVLAQIVPEADIAALVRLTAAERATGTDPEAIRRLAALLPADPALAEQAAGRFRLSNAQKKRLVTASRRDGVASEPRALAWRIGIEEAIDRLLLEGRDAAPLAGWTLPVFPLKGGAIVAHGVRKGPQVAEILRAVEARWVAEGFPEASRVAALLAAELAVRPVQE